MSQQEDPKATPAAVAEPKVELKDLPEPKPEPKPADETAVGEGDVKGGGGTGFIWKRR